MPDCATDSHVVLFDRQVRPVSCDSLAVRVSNSRKPSTTCQRSGQIGAVQLNSLVYVVMPFAVFSVSNSDGVWLRKQAAWGICCCLVPNRPSGPNHIPNLGHWLGWPRYVVDAVTTPSCTAR